MTLSERLNKLPPKLCRFVAHRRRRPLSNQDIATASGLARSTVVKISNLDCWNGVRLDMIEAFTTACGVDLLAPKRSLYIIRKRAMDYTRNANHQQRKMYQRLLKGLGATATIGATEVHS